MRNDKRPIRPFASPLFERSVGCAFASFTRSSFCSVLFLSSFLSFVRFVYVHFSNVKTILAFLCRCEHIRFPTSPHQYSLLLFFRFARLTENPHSNPNGVAVATVTVPYYILFMSALRCSP